eukprot:scaffold3821_cov173-Amphora_coffeaeformis.AAC.21
MNASNSNMRSEDEDGAVEENGIERQAALDRTPQQSNGVKRARGSPVSFNTEEKKDENVTKLRPIQENVESQVEPMKIAVAPESSSVAERAAVEDDPSPIREEEELESAVSKQQQRAQQRDNAESGYSNKARTSEGAHTSLRGGTRRKSQPQQDRRPMFGLPVIAESEGNFPDVGSILGRFFCIGQLGAGTFSSIHKCINLDYFSANDTTKRRLAAAKIELSEFSQSGVLESEAMILEFLHQTLPARTVPVYMGHYKTKDGECAAILMEYLPGQDMHNLRESVMAGAHSRRMNVKDAVYLTADVMLPLLQKMHEVGVVHRDVKPSNVVRSGVDPDDKSFSLVDFGLSKSIVVSADDGMADKEHPWHGKEWLKPRNYEGPACFRKEREKADFRGTSMYASPRVHQLKDYCPRDDVWSVLYVFCDLVSGGLPWMSHAANRDREACQKIKERIHGGNGGADSTAEFLLGDEYHVTQFKNEQKRATGDIKIYKLPEPLAMSRDVAKVEHLRVAFRHVSSLNFWDTPDYALVQKCIKGFLDDESTHPDVKMINWNLQKKTVKKSPESKRVPMLRVMEDVDPVNTEMLDSVENTEKPTSDPNHLDFLRRLPLSMQFRYRQLDRHSIGRGQTPIHVVARAWLALALPLLYEEWDAKKFEEGGHRTSTDGYRRETYLKLLEKCKQIADEFDSFESADWLFHPASEDSRLGEKRKLNPDAKFPLVTITRAVFHLECTLEEEKVKRSPPPVALKFGA